MSFYNMVNGMNASLAVIVSSILGFRVDEYFPRFRDVFTQADDAPWPADVFIYTRMGGGNRDCWGGDEKDARGNCLCPACKAARIDKELWVVGSYDDDFDSTFRTFGIRFTDKQRDKWEETKTLGRMPEDVLAKAEELFPKLFSPTPSAAKTAREEGRT